MEKPHKKLNVWKKAVELSILVYRVTEGFPKSELYGLVGQMRRAAVSIPSNIAEGAARKGSKEFSYFVNVARGSLSELDTHVEISRGLGFLSNSDAEVLDEMMGEIDKMLYGLVKQL
ncbi:MAG: four helix bundle protein [Aquificota bacterium]|nr:MAG: four helix bundle protein [Aquificota bacterium]